MNNQFYNRHVGPSQKDIEKMLESIGVSSLDELVDQTFPKSIISRSNPVEFEAMSEAQYLEHIDELAKKNTVYKSYIGMGYYNTHVPSVILRNIFENPGWYTQYTPYQPEISQGRLEALFNFQTLITDLTKMDIANASLLDEATAAAEAMTLLYRFREKDQIKKNADTFIVDKNVFPQTINVLKTRSKPLGLEIRTIDTNSDEIKNQESGFGLLLQYPDSNGQTRDYDKLIKNAKKAGLKTVMVCDLLSLSLLKAPGELGADVAVGSTQRFGVPMGFGGPHAAYFATRDEFKRSMPGRLVGLSRDSYQNPAYRLALQTREQHIRREKATSNICTAQALLAIMAGMYAVYHGPDGIKEIAMDIHQKACNLNDELKKAGYSQLNDSFFDTLRVDVSVEEMEKIQKKALANGINFRYFENGDIGISLDETSTFKNLQEILLCFGVTYNTEFYQNKHSIPDSLKRSSPYLQHAIFNSNHSETGMMRYIKNLENRDLALNTAMIPLGSCTMKLNPATAMMAVSRPEFANIHPYAPESQVSGYLEMINWLEKSLAQLTGLAATSLQPNSGAQGEYSGLLAIRAYQISIGQGNRIVALIPASAHGTNPASAAMAGMQVVVVKCDSSGNIDVADLKLKSEKHKENLSCLMVTYPSTHGVFEEPIKEICQIIHDHGGQVYMDGANLNAQLGITSPGEIGADVCHLNLHKTFAIPHGGGGPGMGPICVANHLAAFLPGDPLANNESSASVSAVSAANYSSASILLISYAYIKMLGSTGLTQVTKIAILNANYIKSRLEKSYKILYTGKNNRIAHEMILDTRPFKSDGVDVDDIAKRLMDYGFHAPTMSFPVPGTLMVEPTESEPLDELDRFCDAMIQIRKEIDEVSSGLLDKENNMLKNAPHTAKFLVESESTLPYSKTRAAWPLENQSDYKFWPYVGRIDNVYGDRNLVCSCRPVSEYMEE